MGRSSPPQFQLRMLAPASLVAFFAIFLIVVVASLGGGSDSNTGERQRTGSDRPKREQPAKQRSGTPAGRRVYVVRTGDTLALIAERTGVTVLELQELNPTIDPRALVTGQRIKLR